MLVKAVSYTQDVDVERITLDDLTESECQDILNGEAEIDAGCGVDFEEFLNDEHEWQ